MEKRKDQYYRQSRWTYDSSHKRAVASSTSTYVSQLQLTKAEAKALEIIGRCLFHYKLIDWKACREGGQSLAERKKALRPLIGDRYAYAIVKDNNKQLQLALDNRERDIEQKTLENDILEKRNAQAKKWLEKHPDGLKSDGSKPDKKSYNPLSFKERGRYQHNESVLQKYENGLLKLTFGGGATHRADMRAMQRDPENPVNKQRHHDWLLSRYNIKAIGDSSHSCGNSVLRVNAEGEVRILVPEEIRSEVESVLQEESEERHLLQQKYLVLSEAVIFYYGWDKLLANIRANKAVTSSIDYDKGSWYLRCNANTDADVNKIASKAASADGVIVKDGKAASFANGEDNPAIVARKQVNEAKRTLKKDTVFASLDRSKISSKDNKRRFMGIDVNAGHIDLMVCDIHGNPCGKALTIPYEMYGSSKTNKSSVLHALDRVKHIVERRHVECVFLEELKGFLDSKSRIFNDGGNVFRRTVSSIPCGELRDWLIRKLSSVPGCHVEFVSAAYTSKVGHVFWGDVFADVHQAAALMIARRGLGLRLFRRIPTGLHESSAIYADCQLVYLDDAAFGLYGGDSIVVPDCGEVLGVPSSSNIRDAATSKRRSLRVFRRSHRLVPPGGARRLGSFTVVTNDLRPLGQEAITA